MMKILTQTINRIAHYAARTIRFQTRSLDSLAWGVLNNRIALDYLLTD